MVILNRVRCDLCRRTINKNTYDIAVINLRIKILITRVHGDKMKTKIKSYWLIIGIMITLTGCFDRDKQDPLQEKAQQITQKMTLREKIGEKLMMSFRYWCNDQDAQCRDGFIEINDTVSQLISDNHIGGIILFSANLTDIDQTAQLIWDLQNSTHEQYPLSLFVAIDQEGGNVVRLPRTKATNLPGNMALGSAYLSSGDLSLAYDAGHILAAEVGAVGFNVNFAPVVDVQSNPLNPVINVRAYGEDPKLIGLMAGETAKSFAKNNVVPVFKHFPGHGDTQSDSHYSLPIVNKSREEADATDLYPYRFAIQNGLAPDMIMTAHIQYPALDSTTVVSNVTGEEMILPATLSREIQTQLLRKELQYQGVTITDALDMKGIADHFWPAEAVIKTFQAGVDIALMPVLIHTDQESHQLSELIDQIVQAVQYGDLSEQEITRSVERIVKTKLKYGLIKQDNPPSIEKIKQQAHHTIGKSEHKIIQKNITEQAITLIRNTEFGSSKSLPVAEEITSKVHVIMPNYGEGDKAKTLKNELVEHGFEYVSASLMSQTTKEDEQQIIDESDIIIIGTASTKPSPVENNGDVRFDHYNLQRSLVFNANNFNDNTVLDEYKFAYELMEYAFKRGKNVIHVTLRAPYDIVNFEKVSHSAIATYNYYGQDNNGKDLGSNVMNAVAKIISGQLEPKGKLPVNIYHQNEDGSLGDLRYKIGHGLTYHK